MNWCVRSTNTSKRCEAHLQSPTAHVHNNPHACMLCSSCKLLSCCIAHRSKHARLVFGLTYIRSMFGYNLRVLQQQRSTDPESRTARSKLLLVSTNEFHSRQPTAKHTCMLMTLHCRQQASRTHCIRKKVPQDDMVDQTSEMSCLLKKQQPRLFNF